MNFSGCFDFEVMLLVLIQGLEEVLVVSKKDGYLKCI
jgi:hypothetical protein